MPTRYAVIGQRHEAIANRNRRGDSGLRWLGGCRCDSLLLDRLTRAWRASDGHAESLRSARRRPQTSATVRAARRLNRAAGMLAASVLADSAVEHYRGSFENKAMFTPLVVSALTLGISIHGTADRGRSRTAARCDVSAGGRLTGLIGTGFHVYNVARSPAAFQLAKSVLRRAAWRARWRFCLSGLLGFLLGAGARHRAGQRRRRSSVFRPAGRWPRVTSARSSWHGGRSRAAAFPRRLSQSLYDAACHPSAARRRLLARAAAGGHGREHWFTRWWMRLTGCDGLRRRRLSRLWRLAQHGRLAQLEPERPQRTAASCAAEFHGPRARRSGRARA